MVARVSIVVRTKDRPYFLARALNDVLAQSFGDWQVIVVNDRGDGAAVRNTVAEFAGQLGDRITVIDTAAPGGRCAAANLGMRTATTDYVALHDDDDRWAPSFLAQTVAWLDEHPADGGVMVTTEIVYEEKRGDEFVRAGSAPFWAGQTGVTYSRLLSVNRGVPISFLYRRSLHDEVGYYDETLDAVEDWEFYLRVALDHPIGYIAGEPLAFWTQRPNERGAAGNSMYALGDIHQRDDQRIRDDALRAYVREAGPGLPLFIAGLVETEVRRQVDDALNQHYDIDRFTEVLRRELDQRHPIWSRVRRWRQRARVRRTASGGDAA